MDIALPREVLNRRRVRRLASGVALLLLVVVTTVALARLKAAVPTVDASALWTDTVRRGTMLRQVRGLGVLVPDEIRWIPAATEGRVERILVQPGSSVAANTVLLQLSNPQVEQEAQAAELALRAARAQFDSLEADLQKDLLSQRASAASIDADYAQAQMQAEVNEALLQQGLIDALTVKQSTLKSETLATRQRLEQERLASSRNSVSARLEVQRAEVDQRQAMAILKRNQAAALEVRAGVAGVLQQVPVEVGQRVAPGTNLARVADPTRLKAELRIAETQVKDIAVGQPAAIDTRNGIVKGRVARIDPAAQNGTVTVDIALDDVLPRGARPDMSVDGTIELERLMNVLYVGRPAFGLERNTVTLFKLDPDGKAATRTPVMLGRSSVNMIEIVSGLSVEDRVILSDMSTWDSHDRIRLR
jgi:HlyD family secretion protein